MANKSPPRFLKYRIGRNLAEEEVVADVSFKSRRKTSRGWEL
jgi:hypothetical protein